MFLASLSLLLVTIVLLLGGFLGGLVGSLGSGGLLGLVALLLVLQEGLQNGKVISIRCPLF